MSHTELVASSEDRSVARLAALAIGLALCEATLPSPLPGVKPGLANIVVLLVLHRYGIGTAAWVSLLRVTAGSLLFGSFLGPTFVLSFTGAALSLGSLVLAVRLPKRWFGPVSHSIVSSFAHIAGQMSVVYLWLIPNPGIVVLLPVFAAAALVFGTANGLIAARLLRDDKPVGESAEYVQAPTLDALQAMALK